MARIVFISPYMKGSAARRANLTRYIATRDGVEKLYGTGEVSTTGGQRKNLMDYIAHRPGVAKLGDHGLWNAAGKVPALSDAVREVAEHPGNVWTPVVSIRREDAERLGYASADSWRALVNSVSCDIARGYKIHPDRLRWYAAFHEKENQVHIHMIIFSTDPKEGYLTRRGIREIKSAFARQIFRQDLLSVYERQTEQRNTLQENARVRMVEILAEMRRGGIRSEKLEQLTMALAERLRHISGRKVYGYLPPRVKRLVDEIVDELAKDPRVAEAYALWQEMREEVCRTYSDNLPPRLPLSRQKEFKAVRNMVIRETMRLLEMEPTVQSAPTASAASAGTAVLRMLHHMAGIFRENTATENAQRGVHMDKKRRKMLREKRLALGHRADDHEQHI